MSRKQSPSKSQRLFNIDKEANKHYPQPSPHSSKDAVTPAYVKAGGKKYHDTYRASSFIPVILGC